LVLTIGIIPSGLAVGWLSDKFGASRLIVFSQLGLGCCFIALGLFTTSLTTLYGIYFLMAVLASGTLPITFSKLVSARFQRHRGLALGITLCGTGAAAAVVPLYATAVMERFGWRAAYIAIGLLPILIALPLSLALLRDNASTQDNSPARPAPMVGASLATALRSYRFWVLGAAFFLISGVVTGVLTNLVPLLVERGFEPTWAANLVGLFGITVVAGRLAAGALFDRIWAPLVAAGFLAPAALGLIALTQQSVPTAGVVMAVLAVASATGMELDLSAFLTARYFGRRNFGRIYGGVFVMLLVGGGIAAQLTGSLYDYYGSYTATLYGGAGCVVLCALLLLTLGRYPVDQPGDPTEEAAHWRAH
jgi:MFS family permease